MSHKQEEKKASEGKTEVFSLSYPEIPDLEVFSVLGKGGSGTVYKGQQPFLKRDVAIKVLNVTHGAINEEFVERFHREAQILADLIHPNIVSCFQAGMTTEASNYPISPYIVMEFVEGPSLQDWIKKVGVVDQITALSIIEKVASALDYAFRKSIIHRDIKAENILLKPLNTNNSLDSEFDFVPKLADLGIARSTQKDKKSNLTVVGTMIGTPSAMAPEQFNDPDNVDFKADIYGLGCVLFHMVTGTKPYEGYNLTEMVISKNSSEVLNPKEINSKLNKKIVNLILSLMAVDKNDRPSSYENLMQQCQTVRLALNKKNNIKIHSSEKKILKWGIMISVFSLLIAALVYSLGPKLTVSDSIISVPLPNTVTTPIVKEAISQPDPIPNIVTSPVVKEAINQPDPTPKIVTSPVVKEAINQPDSTLNIITPSVVKETINQPDPTPNIVTSPVVKEVIKQPDSTPNIVTTPVVKEVINHPVPDISVENTNNERNVNKMESSLEIRYADKNDVFLAPGEAFNVMVSTQQDAYVYCYFEDQKGEVTRFFPNRFNSEPYVLHSKPLILPGESQFNLNASEDGVSERLACFSTDQNVINQLPPEIFGTDFEKLPVKSLEEVKALYIKMNTIEVSDYFFDIRVY